MAISKTIIMGGMYYSTSMTDKEQPSQVCLTYKLQFKKELSHFKCAHRM